MTKKIEITKYEPKVSYMDKIRAKFLAKVAKEAADKEAEAKKNAEIAKKVEQK